jgi:hypothetical protein
MEQTIVMHKTKIWILLIAAGICSAFYSNTTGNTTAVGCVLSAEKVTYRAGELLQINVSISNNTKKSIYLPGCLDGSLNRFRFPYCYFTIIGPDGEVPMPAGCRTTNRLREEDFVKLKKGDSFNPVDGRKGFAQDPRLLTGMNLDKPGRYKIRLHYSTMTNNLNDYCGIEGAVKDSLLNKKLLSVYKKIPRVDLVSNELEVVIEK